MKKFLLSIPLLLIGICESKAQIQTNNAMFNLNPSYYNPAFAGFSESGFNAVISSRADWVSFNNVSNTSNPWNALVSIDKRIDSKKIGFGSNLANINLGRMNLLDLSGNVAYHLHINESNQISFATKIGFNYLYLGDQNLRDDADDIFANSVSGNYLIPKIGLGIAYKNENFFAGFASPDLIVSDSKHLLAANGLMSNNHFNLNAGYKLKLNEDFYLQPSFLSIINPNAISKTDINMVIGKKESYWGGFGYSQHNSYSVMGGITLNGRLNLSYAFTLYNTLVANPTSHELCLNWDLEDIL